MQNQVFSTRREAVRCRQGQLVLVQDLDTGLLFNQDFQPELIHYASDYQNEQSLSRFFQDHLNQVADIIGRNFTRQALVEVGCGKGHFLEQLLGSGFDIRGCDPTYEGSNPRILKKFFSPELGQDCQGIILRHVMEHIPDPLSFLASLRDSLGGPAKVYIEVPCFDWICQEKAWFDVFYEHVNYFRLQDLRRMFGQVYESGSLFGNQYLYVVADLSTLSRPVYDDSARAHVPPDFLESVQKQADRLRGRQPGSVAIWGGASKGVIFTLYMQRAGLVPLPVIDVNPAKQGKFLPSTGIRVESPESISNLLCPGAEIVVMNRNYLSEIRAATGNQFAYSWV